MKRKNVLKFTGSQVSLSPDIRCAFVGLGELSLGSDTKHALESIQEQYCDKSACTTVS